MRTTSLSQLNILLQSQMAGKSMRIKPTSVYENMWIYYILIPVNLLHVLVTFCGHIQGGVLTKDILQCGLQTQHHHSTWMVTDTHSTLTLLTHVNSAHIILSVNCIFKINILHLYMGLVVFVIHSLQKCPPEYGHQRWTKHVWGLQWLKCNKFIYFHMHRLVLFS